MKISTRLSSLNVGGSDGWEIFYEARAREAAGQRIVNLTIGDHDAATPAAILDAMHASACGGHTGYPAIPGTDDLRRAIADRITRHSGIETGLQNVLVTAGGQAALFAAHMIATEPGDTALFVDPYYATYPGTVRATSAVAKSIPAPADAGFLPDLAALDAAAPSAKSLLINSPNNPTGVIYTAGFLADLAAVVCRHDLWLISDEVYESQIFKGVHVSPRSLPGMAERTLVVGSFSKSHRMTGARIGWLVGPEAAIEAAGNLAVNTTYGVAGFIQDAATAALAAGPDVEEDVAATYGRRRHLALQALDGLGVCESDGGMYVMLDVRSTGLSGLAFAQNLLEATGVAVMPGESFGNEAAGQLRIALTVPDDTLVDALRLIRGHLETLT